MTKPRNKESRLIKPQTLKGFRDFLPQDMRVRQKVIDILRGVFQSFGFEPLETPTLEYAKTLLGKYGEDADRLVYLFKDRGGREVGMRYDLTVPLARVVAQNPNLPFPFKRYQMQPVWRAEKTQKGRYREFWQCDVDIVGSKSPLADAEIVALIYKSLRALGFEKFVIKINSRQILFKLMEEAAIPQKRQLSIIRSIDKLEKVGFQGVEEELIQKGLSLATIKKLFSSIEKSAPDSYLQEVLEDVGLLGVPDNFWQFEPTLARGLDYYTGPIFETVVEKPKIGSITGGGRWDELIGRFTGKDIPATGTTIGIERIIDVIKELRFWPELKKTPIKALVTIFSPELLPQSVEMASILRELGFDTELYVDPSAPLEKQLKYTDKRGIPFAIIVGPGEVKKSQVTIKDMRTGEQKVFQGGDPNEIKELLGRSYQNG